MLHIWQELSPIKITMEKKHQKQILYEKECKAIKYFTTLS